MAMEILTAIIPTILDYTIRPVARQVGYIIFYKSNVEDLRSKLEDFDSVKQGRKHEVDEVGRKVNHEVKADVKKWLSDAENTTREADALLHDEGRAKTKCLIICPNLIYYHQRSRKSTKLVEKIEAHKNKNKEFSSSSLSYEVPVEDVSAIASDEYMAFESRISMVKDIITELKKPDINRIGVYGLGGVGKTTLAKEVYREVVKEKLFDDVVIILNVKEKKDNEKIQNEITRKLSMDVDESKDMGTRASLLRARIKDGKTLVILDDVLERIDFEDVGVIGVPHCKLLLTSRERNVLFYDMHTQKNFELGFLKENESWSLFEKMAGNVVKDNRILKEATGLAKKCGGLPVLVVAVASALRESNLEEWKDALRSFKRFDKKEMNEKAFLALKWSYEQLEDLELKQLFLLCGSCSSFLSDLLKYSMGLGLIKNVETVEEARNSFNGMVKKLKNSCLLLDSYDNETVRMHELVRDVAIRIASDDQKAFSRAYGDKVKDWPNGNFLKICTSMSLRECLIPRFPEVPWECPELKFLVLWNDDIDNSQEIPSKFFEGMKELKVLDVTAFSIQSLPPSLKSLKHLHTLCLDGCELVDITLVGQLTNLKVLSLLNSKIKELPKEIGELTRLQLLDLTGCSELVVISPGVISSLTRLEDLRMGIKSFKQWEGEGLVDGRRSNVSVSELKHSNASVSELKHLSHLSALDIHVPDANLLPTNLFSDKLERYTILIGDCWECPDIYGTSSNMLKLKLTRRNQFDRGIKLLVKRCEQLYLDGMESVNIISYLFDSEAVKQLKHLHVQNNDEVKYVINSVNWSYSHNAFSSLEFLSLGNLVSLETVCYGQLIGEHFQKLKSLKLQNLPKLIGFSSKDKQLMVDTEANGIVLEDEVGGPPRLFSNGEVLMPNLTTLTVHQCHSLRFLFSSSMAKCLGQLEHLTISKCQALQMVYDILSTTQLNGFECPNLNSVEIDSCDSLKNVFPASVAKDLKQLRKLKVENCNLMEEIVAKEEGPQTTYEEFRFPKVTFIEFHNLPQLKSFYPGLHVSNWPSLNTLKFTKCSGVEIFVGEFSTYQDKLELGHPRLTKQPFFLIEKVLMSNLTTLIVHQCDSLRFLFSSFMAKCFGQLKNLKISNCQIMEEIVRNEENIDDMFDKLNRLELQHLPNLARFISGSYIKFPSLTYLNLDDCTKLETFIFGAKSGNITTNKEERDIELFDEKVGFPSLETLYIWDLPKLKTIFHNQLHSDSFGKLRNMDVRRCHSLINIFGLSMMGRLNAIESLAIKQCQSLQVIYDTSSTTQLNCFEFSEVTYMMFEDLPQLRSFYPVLHVSNWPLLNEERDIQLFDEKVGFPSLEMLYIWDLPKLKTIFHNQLHSDSFGKLKIMDVRRCHNLINIFGPSMMGRLNALETLTIKQCQSLQVVYDTSSTTQLNCFEFSKVTYMMFEDLPQLRSFYPALHVSNWPLLNELNFKKCANVEIFASESSTYQEKLELGHPTPMKQPFFLIEKGKSFTNLEYLMLDENTEIWYELYGPLPAELLSKLKSFCFATSHPKSDVFFENLQNIEKLHVLSAPWKELFVYDHQGSGRRERHEVETFPRVKTLSLIDMPELIHLGMENSQPGGLVFPNLEILGLEKCGRLENLASTLISFRNLTNLAIRYCHGLQYLIPYSVAKNLQQLKEFEVKSCKRMVEIVARNRDDPENETTFSCLQHLELSDLPSLQGFCTGNCIFKVPSLLSNNLIVEKCQLIELTISLDGLLQSDTRPERLQIAEETDDVLKLSDSKENERDQTEQLVIADSNVDVTIARNISLESRLEEISAWRADWKAL